VKNLKVLFLLLVLSFAFVACGPYNKTVKEFSAILEEDATVVDLVYTPSRHGSGSGIGPTFDTDGNLGIAFTNITVDIPEKYAIVFKCQHGKFIIECNTPERRKLWNDLDEGQKVKVKYREAWLVTYRVEKKEKTPIAKALKDYWFLTAEPK
jgi:hypothetical protein